MRLSRDVINCSIFKPLPRAGEELNSTGVTDAVIWTPPYISRQWRRLIDRMHICWDVFGGWSCGWGCVRIELLLLRRPATAGKRWLVEVLPPQSRQTTRANVAKRRPALSYRRQYPRNACRVCATARHHHGKALQAVAVIPATSMASSRPPSLPLSSSGRP